MKEALQQGSIEYRWVIGVFAKPYPEQSPCFLKHVKRSSYSVHW